MNAAGKAASDSNNSDTVFVHKRPVSRKPMVNDLFYGNQWQVFCSRWQEPGRLAADPRDIYKVTSRQQNSITYSKSMFLGLMRACEDKYKILDKTINRPTEFGLEE